MKIEKLNDRASDLAWRCRDADAKIMELRERQLGELGELTVELAQLTDALAELQEFFRWRIARKLRASEPILGEDLDGLGWGVEECDRYARELGLGVSYLGVEVRV